MSLTKSGLRLKAARFFETWNYLLGVVGGGVGGVPPCPPPVSTMLRARFHASMKRLPASVPSNCKARSSMSVANCTRAAVSVSTSRNKALLRRLGRAPPSENMRKSLRRSADAPLRSRRIVRRPLENPRVQLKAWIILTT